MGLLVGKAIVIAAVPFISAVLFIGSSYANPGPAGAIDPPTRPANPAIEINEDDQTTNAADSQITAEKRKIIGINKQQKIACNTSSSSVRIQL
jgi:hypothetical protein